MKHEMYKGIPHHLLQNLYLVWDLCQHSESGYIWSGCQNGTLAVVNPKTKNLLLFWNLLIKDSLQFLVNKYISDGIPGAQVVFKNDDGWFYYSGGYAKIETKDSFKSGGVFSY